MRITARVFDKNNNKIGWFKITDYISRKDTQESIKFEVKSAIRQAYKLSDLEKDIDRIDVVIYNKHCKRKALLCTAERIGLFYNYKFNRSQIDKFSEK